MLVFRKLYVRVLNKQSLINQTKITSFETALDFDEINSYYASKKLICCYWQNSCVLKSMQRL